MIIPTFKITSDVELTAYNFSTASDKDPIIVFTHPTGFTSGMYSSVCAHLRGITSFGIDIRSHGLSDRGKLDTWNNFDKDLDALFSHLEIITGQKSFIGAGISSGSSAHILHAAKNPSRYKALFLCEPILFTPETDLSSRNTLAKSARARRADFESKYEVFSRFRSKGALSHISDSALALYAKYGFRNTEHGVTLSCPKSDEEAIYLSGAANGVFEALGEIKTETLIVNGEKSNTISSAFAKELARKIPNGDQKEMPGVGHFTLFENPVLGANMISEFIDKVRYKCN